jgi:hypothetical protein
VSDFRVNEVVNIAIEGARVDEVVKNGIHVVMPNGATASIELSNYEGLTVERAAPPGWPPLLGDLWRDKHGSVWFALGRPVLMIPGDPVGDLGGYEPDKVLAKVGPLTLAHREGASS